MSDIQVPSPMKVRPYYAFDHTPTIMEMRMRALQAFDDFLSIQWKSPRNFDFHKTGCVSGKLFHYETDKVYAGVPYTNAGKGIFQMWEYYNTETGLLDVGDDPQWFNWTIGGTCACGVMWSLAAVCHSLTGTYVNFDMVPKHGCYPVGYYKFDPFIDSYHEHSTGRIIAENGREVMLSALAQVLPADAVTSFEKDHTMMCLSPAHTVYNADGTINGDESYIIIRDQQGGFKKGYFEIEKDGMIINYHGRMAHKYSFNWLLDQFYIPLTTAEFSGRVEYQRAKVSFQGQTDTLENFLKGYVVCNYPMAVVKIFAVDKDGKETQLAFRTQCRAEVRERLARRMPLKELGEITVPEGTVSVKAVAYPSNGEVLTAAEVTL